MKPDTHIEVEVTSVPERFCSAFAESDAEAVLPLCASDPDLVEDPLLREPRELRAFLERYVNGLTTYCSSPHRRAAAPALAPGLRNYVRT